MATSLYVHVPFCTHICYYCDFNKVYLSGQPVDAYIEAVGRELALRMKDQTAPLRTIYIGGGTPTALSAGQMQRLLSLIEEHASAFADEMEYTVEVNPDEVDPELLKIMSTKGVNRLSIGVQTFEPELLKTIGRTHSPSQVEETIQLARSYGFDNISIDLMFGLPKQSLANWQETLKKATELAVPHISAYSLKVEEKTMFYNWWRNGRLPLLTQEEEAKMYEVLENETHANGLNMYEISNFARPGFESAHNRTYWLNQEYIGVGAGAHGYLNRERYENTGPVSHYINQAEAGDYPVREHHLLTEIEQMEEQMFMGLRMIEGVNKDMFYQTFGQTVDDVFSAAKEELTSQELLEETPTHVRLTKKGKLLGNEVFERFLLG
ncbi:radical SAM family heme chaperone HemW [Salsuginibacillus kocurii]|uniref:radical SAM family heme chaperone HemW n=1 Tax=Salsuginibacillus kocurii TaxID=427078 RepID=UPI0003748159|nr:radical SAM family heme chaperone HemW [Salsuginibacillus kocurii]